MVKSEAELCSHGDRMCYVTGREELRRRSVRPCVDGATVADTETADGNVHVTSVDSDYNLLCTLTIGRTRIHLLREARMSGLIKFPFMAKGTAIFLILNA